MTVVLDHTIVPVNDREQAVEFYARIFGFEELGEVGPFLALRVNDSLNLDFRKDEDFSSIHYAFAMEPDEFEAAFQRIKDAKIPYGDSPFAQDNMQGPGMSPGARGDSKGVYFKDPSGHLLEIKTY
jgi:catechol 2,3-dioxygenase-like lactoylglutathione lyase family enzyme